MAAVARRFPGVYACGGLRTPSGQRSLVDGGTVPVAYATTAQLNAETAARKSADTTETAARIAADNALDARLDVLGPTVADINARLAAVEAWIGTYPPPTPVPVTGSAYGSGLSGDSRANQQVGAALNARLAYRFRATRSSAAQTLRVQERGGTVYSGGNGGTIRASIQADSGGNPSGTPLASLTWTPGNPAGNWEVWTLHTFSAPASLTAGTLYHLVFENTAAAPTTNWISLNMLYTFGSLPTPRQAAFSDDFATLYAQPTTWQIQPQHCPIFDLAYADGGHDGQGYIGTLWDRYGNIAGSTDMTRERFTIAGGAKTVASAHVRLKRISGNGALVVRLENGDGSLIESVSVPASGIAIGQVPDGSAGSLAGDTWVTVPFVSPHVLANGSAYNLRLSTDSSTRYTAVPIQQGTSKGLASQVFADGDGQRTTDGGSTWANLYQFDSTDLQFWLEAT